MLALIGVIVTVFVVVAILLGLEEMSENRDVRAWCAAKTYPDPSSGYKTEGDCAITASRGSDFTRLAGGAVVGWLLYAGITLMRWVRRPAFFRVLDDTPDEVVWAFSISFTLAYARTPGLRRKLVVATRGGKRLALWVRSPDEAQELLADIARRCPNITLGHSNEHERAFAVNPAAMRRAAS